MCVCVCACVYVCVCGVCVLCVRVVCVCVMCACVVCVYVVCYVCVLCNMNVQMNCLSAYQKVTVLKMNTLIHYSEYFHLEHTKAS